MSLWNRNLYVIRLHWGGEDFSDRLSGRFYVRLGGQSQNSPSAHACFHIFTTKRENDLLKRDPMVNSNWNSPNSLFSDWQNCSGQELKCLSLKLYALFSIQSECFVSTQLSNKVLSKFHLYRISIFITLVFMCIARIIGEFYDYRINEPKNKWVHERKKDKALQSQNISDFKKNLCAIQEKFDE